MPSQTNIESFRASWAQFALPESAGPLADKVTTETWGPGQWFNNPCYVRIYWPDELSYKEPSPVILATAGGGFIANYLYTNQAPWSRIAKATGCPVISYRYTPAPEGAFDGYNQPLGLQQAQQMALWLSQNAESMALDPHSIILLGDSSGANFAIYQAVAMYNAGLQARGLAVISPAVDLSRRFQGFESYQLQDAKQAESYDKLLPDAMVQACYDLYAPNHQSRIKPIISPLYINDLAKKLPSTAVIVASCDRLKRDAYAFQMKYPQVQLIQLSGVHAFLTARNLLGNEPGKDPAKTAADYIQLFIYNHSD